MKFKVSTSALQKELQILSGAISSNTVLPILEDFLFEVKGENLTIYASDLETSMSSNLSVEADESLTMAIPAKLLLDTLKALPDQPLDFVVDKDNYLIEIQAQNGNYKLAGESGADFPNIPEAENTSETSIPSTVLSEAIQKTIFAVSNDELRPAMTGIYMELDTSGTTFVSTDAHKLVKFKNKNYKSDKRSSFIIPKKAMNLIKTALGSEDTDVSVSFNPSNAFFSFNNVNLICRLIDSKFPDYNAVIPKDNKSKLTVNRLDFLNSIKRVSLFASKTTNQVILGLTNNKMSISAKDMDYSNEAKEEIACVYNGEKMDIAFNAKFLSEILTVMETDEVCLNLSTPSKAGLIVPPEDSNQEELVMLVMPIMINN